MTPTAADREWAREIVVEDAVVDSINETLETIRDRIVGALGAAHAIGRAAGLEEAAKIAESVTGAEEQEMIRDLDGPWVLSGDVAAAIRHAREET